MSDDVPQKALRGRLALTGVGSKYTCENFAEAYHAKGHKKNREGYKRAKQTDARYQKEEKRRRRRDRYI